MRPGLRTLLVLGVVGATGGGHAPVGEPAWEAVRPGLEFRTQPHRGGGEGRWTRLVMVRVDPARYRLGLDIALSATLQHGAWVVDSAPPEAAVALNAGQFNGIAPWGWTVRNGLELRPPGVGPLSMAVVEERDGRVRFVPPDSIAAVRRDGRVVNAIQSYPTLLEGDGVIPEQLTTPGLGVGIRHRDARLALCALKDGRLLVLLTRFDGLGEVGGSVPFGLTLAETAHLLQQQGCRRAVALDGGISSQLLLRQADGREHAWRGWRKVPLGLVFEER